MLPSTGTQSVSENSDATLMFRTFVSRQGDLHLSNFTQVCESDAIIDASGQPDDHPTLRHDLA